MTEQDKFQDAAARLDAHNDYRVLRRIPPSTEWQLSGVTCQPRERIAVSGWGRDEYSIVREADVALIEQVVDMRAQQQTVIAIELLEIRGHTPRLDVTRPKVSLVGNAG